MTQETRLGTSGWSYKEWEGVFYPKGENKKLSYYSRYFNTVEIDSTFYAYPKAGTIIGCDKATPDDFTFSVKLPKLITHDKRLDLTKGVSADLFRFLDLLRPLVTNGKLGPLLIQLPPSFDFDACFQKLRAFLEVIPSDLRFAVEFRHRSWLREETWELLRSQDVANTIVDEPLLPPDPIVTTDFAFLRWHGHGRNPWYNYRYDEATLKEWAARIGSIERSKSKVFGYFNNHFHGFAVENALAEQSMISELPEEKRRLLSSVRRRIDASLRTKDNGVMQLDGLP